MNEFLAEMYGTADTIGMTKQAELEKRAEEDFLGRVMAHAFVNELSSIEKTAGWGGALKGAIPGSVLGGLGGAGVGALTSDEEHQLRNALIGGAIGAGSGGLAGGLGGHLMGGSLGEKLLGKAQELSPGRMRNIAEAGVGQFRPELVSHPDVIRKVQEAAAATAPESLHGLRM